MHIVGSTIVRSRGLAQARPRLQRQVTGSRSYPDGCARDGREITDQIRWLSDRTRRISIFGSDIRRSSMPASEPESVLYELAAALRKGVAIRTRRLGLRSHKHTFLGSDAVTWLVENAACRHRDDAVELGRNLHHAGLFRPIVGTDPFQDDKNSLYRFAEDDVGDDELSGSKSVSVKPSDGVKPLVERLTGRRTSVPTKGIRSLLLKKKGFCPIESLLTVAPSTTFGFRRRVLRSTFLPHTVHNSIALTVAHRGAR